MVNDLHDMIRVSCEEIFDSTAAAEYEAWLNDREAEWDEREAEWGRAMAYADAVGA
jgi:hypothetical protein